MNLDWDFYYDSWLIDKVPDGLEIRIEETPKGFSFNPPSLTCYFGANPIYLYGEGKLFHEAIMSPNGFAIYPEFLGRPGFEFVSETSFSVSFDKAKDFNGNSVIDKHVGWVDATSFLQLIEKNMYGMADNQYASIRTASSKLRMLNADDYRLQQEDLSQYQVFDTYQSMKDEGCTFYCNMDGSTGSAVDNISGTSLATTSPGTLITIPGNFGDVILLRNTYIELGATQIAALKSPEFQILFSTQSSFREGILFDFGSTNNANANNYGFRLEILSVGLNIIMNTGAEYTEYNIPFEIDFRFPHRFSLLKTGTYIIVAMDGDIVAIKDNASTDVIVFDSSLKNYISGSYKENNMNLSTGDIEEVAFFNQRIEDERMDLYTRSFIPIVKRGGITAINYENVPMSLSYNLTYAKPTYMFIPNFFGGDISNVYLHTSSDTVISAGGEDKSLTIPNGYKTQNVITNNLEENIDFTIGTKLPLLTKVTSDTHIPLKIKMVFQLPEWYDKKTTYSMRLITKSLKKFLWYSFRKYKTGEFV